MPFSAFGNCKLGSANLLSHKCQLNNGSSSYVFASTKRVMDRRVGRRGGSVSCKAENGGSHSAVGDGEWMPQGEFPRAADSLLDAPGPHRHLAMSHSTSSILSTSSSHQGSSPAFAPGVQSSPEWNSWLQYFQQSDSAAEKRDELGLKLKEAVARENYSEAALVKAEVKALEAADAVASVQCQLQAALSEEKYVEAASLRDEGLTGLQGWWAGQAEDDPVGHLLFVKPEYSRWTGRVFRPRDIADMKVRKPDIVARVLPRQPRVSTKPTGTPIMEVFLRPEGHGHEGNHFVHQAVSLRLPTFDEVERRRSSMPPTPPLATPALLQSEEEPDPSNLPLNQVVRLNVCILNDGTTRIRPLPPKLVKSQFKAWEAAEAEETMRMLRWSSSSERGGAANTGNNGGPRPVVEPDEVVQMPQIPDEVIDIASQNAMSSMDSEDGPVVVVPSGDSPQSENDQGWRSRAHPIANDATRLEELFTELTREPARVKLTGRDQMVFHVPDGVFYKEPGTKSRPANGGPMSTDTQARSSRPLYSGPATLLRLEDSMPPEEDSGSSFEFIIPVPTMSQAPINSCTQGHSGEQMLQSPVEAVPAETLNILADQLAQSMEARVGHAAPREEIAEALREVVRRVAAGEPVSSVDVTLGSTKPEMAGRSIGPTEQEPDPDSMTSIRYKRIPDIVSSTDPLSGLYMGSFGPHGPELLHLTRSMVEGEEVVQAMKLTGDANVPAGSLSFRAKVGRKQRLDSRDVYPDELGIVARYKGEGRVAQKGYTQPRWVDGELLVFSQKGSPVTGGSQLGFVWAVPGEKRFLILLNRVDLSDVGK